jgi:hypothetical protein
MLKNVAVLLAAATMIVAGAVAATALGGNPHGQPPGQDPCSHGATGKPCKPDPQPEHGKDCEKHGKNGGVNEDHCKPDETTPTDTTPTDTTPTTPTDTTPTTPTETVPTQTTVHPGQRCPPGMTPTAGKDGQPGNDECEFPKTGTTPSVPPAVAPPATTAPPVATTPPTKTTPPVTSSKPPVTEKPKPKAKPKIVKVVKVTKKPNGVVKITTSDGKTHTGIMGSG